MKTLAIIPARGGSKGVADKNIRLLDGKELIAYTIECALAANRITKTIVSTDSQKIAAVSRAHGAEVMIRPAELATDTAPVVSAVEHVLTELERSNQIFELVVLLQPTSPIRMPDDINKVIGMFEEDPTLEGVVSVVTMNEVHPARMYSMDGAQWMLPLEPEWEWSQRQSLPPVYYRNGCIYAVKTDAFRKTHSVMTSRKKAYVMPYAWLLNIDHERDFVLGETLMKLWKAGKL